MKKIILVAALFLSALVGYSQKDITVGMTGAQVRAAINSNFDSLYTDMEFNAKVYGAVGDNATDNTAVLQALIEQAKVLGGTVYIPAGIYKTHTLTLYWNVTLVGDRGPTATELRSISAEPLINLWHTTFKYINGGIQNIKLNGNGVGTIGFNTQWNGCWSYNNIWVSGFTFAQIYMKGSLVGEFNNCYIQGGQYGVYSVRDTTHSIASNLISFNNCEFYSSSKWAFSCTDGTSVTFKNCDFEGNGTWADSTTGVISYTTREHVDNRYMPGLIVDNGWFEANRGIMIYIYDSHQTAQTQNIITNTVVVSNTSGGLVADLKVFADLYPTKVYLRNTLLGDNTGDGMRIYGAQAFVFNDYSQVWRPIKKTGSESYMTPIDSTGYLNPPSTTAPSDSVYSRGWGLVKKDGVLYKIKLYR